jgi:hypothetical protein
MAKDKEESDISAHLPIGEIDQTAAARGISGEAQANASSLDNDAEERAANDGAGFLGWLGGYIGENTVSTVIGLTYPGKAALRLLYDGPAQARRRPRDAPPRAEPPPGRAGFQRRADYKSRKEAFGETLRQERF